MQVISGGVTITSNKFTMPANDVTVKAIFEQDATPQADKTALNARIAAIGSTAKGNYTDASWNAFQSALTAARNVAASGSATQTEVNSALSALNTAFSNLQLKKMIFSTKYESTFLNWILFFVCFGWIWMWFG